MDKQLVTTAIWKETRNALRLLAAMRGKSMAATMHQLVSEALAEESREAKQ